MATLTQQQMDELKAKSPEDLVKMLAAQHEITDRHERRASDAEGKLMAAEKKAQEDEEARRLANSSETEKERTARLKAEERATKAEERANRITADSAIRIAALAAGASTEDVDDIVVLVRARNPEVDGTKAGELVTALKEQKKHLFGGKGNGWAGDDHQDTGTGHRGGGHGAQEMTGAQLDDAEKRSPGFKMDFYRKGGRRVG